MKLTLVTQGKTTTPVVSIGEEFIELSPIVSKTYKGQKRFFVEYPSGIHRYTSLDVALTTMIQYEEETGTLPSGALKELRSQI